VCSKSNSEWHKKWRPSDAYREESRTISTTFLGHHGYSGVLKKKLGLDSPLCEHALEIEKAGQRAASLTKQLLAFSRQQVLTPAVLNLNSLATDMEKMLPRLLGEDIEVMLTLDPELGNVKADQSQIEQVIMNLAVNARDAMPTGGKLKIQTAMCS